ncbi:hypothetical protein PRZ48_010308 [Zasmidium cellare]|uniref:Uncharacterized protein n=1 Tax=Zasmidium cellare TaxID=395010 RepID=A0ABR0E8F4_ZASCE|nr:hypothetical protein PRZ48_010308 [Zasmidium cellare]
MAATSRDELARVSGPDSMAKPTGSASAAEGNTQNASTVASSSAHPNDAAKPKKKRHRGGRKKKNRRQSFIAPSEATEDTTDRDGRPSLQASRAISAQQASFYRLQSNGNRSNTSLESEALLDHRDQTPFRSRRDTFKQGLARVAMPFTRANHRASEASNSRPAGGRPRPSTVPEVALVDDEDEDVAHDRTPLLASRNRSKPNLSRHNSGFGYGSHGTNKGRRPSNASKSSRGRGELMATHPHNNPSDSLYDVNNPPSVPASPTLESVDDLFIPPGSDRGRDRDAIINIETMDDDRYPSSSPEGMRRRPTIAELAERDVCFPLEEDGSVRGEESVMDPQRDSPSRRRRRRAKAWPDLEVLEEWARDEKEERTHQEVLRAKKISEPVMVGGRLRPGRANAWHAEEDDAPFRFTYFNETLDGTVHARTISDLLQDGMTFRELFQPDPIELSDDSEDDDDANEADDNQSQRPPMHSHRPSSDGEINKSTLGDAGSRLANIRSASIVSKSVAESAPGSGRATPKPSKKRYGPKPTFWLDVLRPTEAEMKVLVKAFGLHQLTAEDILMDEQREKVELFPSYYFINYRTFEQDKDSEDYMDPINMFVVVFRHGLITFHHKMSPHPANVRRRIRQLNDYMSPTADWISYAIIDDVTDAYGPLVSEFEREVDDIDEEILYMHTTAVDNAVASSEGHPAQKQEQRPKSSKGRRGSGNSDAKPQTQGAMGAIKADNAGEKTAGESGGAMLRRIGTCRKTVMGMYRLLGNKADVIKGFAKRCNEHWEVAPRSEIGLYLGDIQDHIVTMTGNLSHFESLLSRAHSNYVAQINIRMNERAEQNADILGKLTVLGTIVLPMNIITGMWGMNVWVPGQEYEGDLKWFFAITAGLIAFGVTCYVVAKRVYGIV